jgi:HNH endonuclease
MSRTYVSAALRQAVVERAAEQCEYCHYPQAVSFLAFEVEHIVAEKHGGATTADNLALACPYCNRFKGTDLGSLDPETNQLIPFYNPRRQSWTEHFRREGGWIVPLTAERRVTVAILQLNHPDRVLERQRLLEAGLL